MKITLNDYIKKLVELRDKFGNDVLLIYSKDDEGNYFNEVIFGASEGNYDRKTHEFISPDDDNKNIKINAICIN